MTLAVLLLIGLVIMAVTAEPKLRTRRLAIIAILVLLGLLMRLMR